MSASSTAWPGQRRRWPNRSRSRAGPQETLTISDSTVTPAMRSAASTARRIACSAASRLVTTPDLMPRERWWPMPSTSIEWVRPRSASLGVARLQPGDQAADLARADIEHGDDRAAGATGRAHPGSELPNRRIRYSSFPRRASLSRSLSIALRPASPSSSGARPAGRAGADRPPRSRATAGFFSSSSAASVASAAAGSSSGSISFDAVVEDDVPAPPGDEHAGAHLRRRSSGRLSIRSTNSPRPLRRRPAPTTSGRSA